MIPEGLQTTSLIERREKLARKLGAAPALIAAGRPVPRVYAANTFLFRASSHYLYLFGLPLEGAFGLWDGQSWTLYRETPHPDEALWSGAPLGNDEVARIVGCPVKDVSKLPARLAGRSASTLPCPAAEGCAEQSQLLGREVRRGKLAPQDEPLADAMIALRLIHDSGAVSELERAADATAAAHRAGMAATRPGILESEVQAAVEAPMTARGMVPSFASIVTVHGEVLHNPYHHRRLSAGDLLLCDAGAETQGGWAGDVTRAWPVSGRFSSTQRELYQVLLAAQELALAAVKPGVRMRDLHVSTARELARGLVALGILKGDPEELTADGVIYLFFPHGLGHLLGLDVHDMEDLGDRAGYAPGRTRSKDFGLRSLRLDRDLVPGMAFTVEPGFYVVPQILADPTLRARIKGRLDENRLAQFSDVRGIRIEDDVLVTANGARVLTAAIPKAPDDLEAALASH